MFTVRLAELNICIENKYNYIYSMCTDYITEGTADFFVSVSEDEIIAEDKARGFDKGYLESLAVYRKIAEKLPEYNGFLLHGVVVDVGGTGIAFLARSGMGKSTHAKLWKDLLKDKITVVNGDKPIVRIIDGKINAYGTAWAGKENMHTNTKTELKKICFIERSEVNECVQMNKEDIFEKLVHQIYLPKDRILIYSIFDFMNEMSEKCEFYLIKCNSDISAAKTACEGTGIGIVQDK